METVQEYLVYWSKQFIIIFGKALNTEDHKHHALQLSIGIDSDIQLSCQQKQQLYPMVLVNSDVVHKLNNKGLGAMILIDSESIVADALKEFLGHNDCIELCFNRQTEFKEQICDVFAKRPSVDRAETLVNELLQELVPTFPKVKKQPDPRVLQVIEIFVNSESLDFCPSDLAKQLFLSESRLQHLFKESTGIHMSRYILWLRTQRTIKDIVRGNSFTEAALKAGFSDSAHFSRTMKATFGVNLRDVLKNSRDVQFIF